MRLGRRPRAQRRAVGRNAQSKKGMSQSQEKERPCFPVCSVPAERPHTRLGGTPRAKKESGWAERPEQKRREVGRNDQSSQEENDCLVWNRFSSVRAPLPISFGTRSVRRLRRRPTAWYPAPFLRNDRLVSVLFLRGIRSVGRLRLPTTGFPFFAAPAPFLRNDRLVPG